MNEFLLHSVAHMMCEVAAVEVMPRWRNLGSGDIAEKSGPDDLVTVADKATEVALTARLTALLPGSVVVGEEAVAADPSVTERLLKPGSVWVIDPIDGTAAFAVGEPDFTLMVALVERGQPLAGWIAAPALGKLAFGGKGLGVRYGASVEAALPVAKPATPTSLRDMVGLLGKRNITEARRAELQAQQNYFKSLDGVTFAGLDYIRLARGEAHFAVYNKCEPWDHLPGLALVGALGFAHARHDGTAYQPHAPAGGLLVSPASQLEAIRSVLLI
ncbi:MAG: inositol monophosphatase family protein [Hyphomicrobiaceae bacterium]